jgi:hypothetical protein
VTAAQQALAQQLADPSTRDGLAAFAFLQAMETLAPDGQNGERRGAQVAAWIDEWQLGRMLGDALRAAGIADARIWQLIMLIKIALQQPTLTSLESLVQDENVALFLNVNRFDNVTWFNKEQYGVLLNWLQVVGALNILRDQKSPAQQNAALTQEHARWKVWREAEAKSEYQLEKLLDAANPLRKELTLSPLPAPRGSPAARKQANRGASGSTARPKSDKAASSSGRKVKQAAGKSNSTKATAKSKQTKTQAKAASKRTAPKKAAPRKAAPKKAAPTKKPTPPASAKKPKKRK